VVLRLFRELFYVKNILSCTSKDKFDIKINEFEAKLIHLVKNASKYDCNKVIVSAENLINRLGSNDAQKIHNLFSKYFNNVKVIYYFRIQEDFILSSWQQWNHKLGTSIEEYVNKCIKKNIPNYYNICEFLTKYYGRKNLQVIPLNRKLLYNNNLIEDFMSRAGIKLESLDLSNRIFNETLNPYLCEVLSKMHGVYSSVHDASVKKKLLRYTNDSEILLDKAPSFLSLSERKRIRKHFERHNKSFHAAFLDNYDYDEVFSLANSILANKKERDVYLQDLVQAFVSCILSNID